LITVRGANPSNPANIAVNVWDYRGINERNYSGRPEKVELLVLIDRKHTRELPISADYVGQQVNTLDSQRVLVELNETRKHNKIWLVNKD
jgi:pyrimidine operon attenuation protein/uracil phosphoribosyltransferase